MQLKVSTTADLPGLARCQIGAFPASLSSRLGTRFCSKMLEWYIVAERGVLLHVVDDGRIVGYCSGVATKHQGHPGPATSIVQYAFWEFALAFVRRPWLLLHPDLMERRRLIRKNLVRKFRRRPAPLTVPSGLAPKVVTHWGVVGIGVLPEYQRRGVGALLLNEFERMARADGVDELQLSVKQDNERAISFYQRQGWQIAVTGKDAYEMSKSLRGNKDQSQS